MIYLRLLKACLLEEVPLPASGAVLAPGDPCFAWWDIDTLFFVISNSFQENSTHVVGLRINLRISMKTAREDLGNDKVYP